MSKRSEEQNAKMWAMLTDISRQLLWPVNGREVRMCPADWKHVLSAGLKKEQRVAAGIDGGFVILGQHTSRFTVGEMADMITLMEAFGSTRNVVWTDPKLEQAA